MDHLHQEGTRVYFHCLTRLRNDHLCKALTDLAQQEQQHYGYEWGDAGRYGTRLN
jgi:hypothetical protein